VVAPLAEIVGYGEWVAGWLVGAGDVCLCSTWDGVVGPGAVAYGEVVETVPVVDPGGCCIVASLVCC
jgi:hypothetical protein